MTYFSLSSAAQLFGAQSQDDRRHVGFSQQESGQAHLGGGYPQSQFRQASAAVAGSAPSKSPNTHTVYSQRLPSSRYRQANAAQSNSAPVRLAQSSLVNPGRWANSYQVYAQKKLPISLSTAIASSSSVSKYKQGSITGVADKRKVVFNEVKTQPVEQGTQRTGQYLSGSTSSVKSPFKGSYFFTPTSQQKLPGSRLAAKSPSYQQGAAMLAQGAQRGSTAVDVRSQLFSGGGQKPLQPPIQMRTSATARGRKVPLRRATGKPSPSVYSQSERATKGLHQSKLFTANTGNYKPTDNSNALSNQLSYSQSRRLRDPSDQRVSYMSMNQKLTPRSGKTTWAGTNQNNVARNLPAFSHVHRQSGGTSGLRYAPTKTYMIPQRFGGFPIRRLKWPRDEVSIRRPQLTRATPPPQQQRQPALPPSSRAVHPKSKWIRVKGK